MMRRKIHARPRFWLLLSLTAALVFSVSLLVTHSRLDAASAQVSALTEQRDQLVREIGELRSTSCRPTPMSSAPPATNWA